MEIFLLAVLTMLVPIEGEAPLYILEPVGIEFGYLPDEICPLIEGEMTEESGALSGQPNNLGFSFGCYYWKTETPILNTDLWIEEKLTSVLPPNLTNIMRTSTPTWSEGSTATNARGSLSLGLMSEVGFTFSPPGGSMGRGSAYGIFRNGYSVILVMYGPTEHNPQNYLEDIVSFAVLSEESVSE